jgi:uncharacterized membrane protein (UPF0182 family)
MRFSKQHGTALLIFVAACVFLLPTFATLYTDWLWFDEVKLQAVFLRRITAQAWLGLIVFGVVLAVLFFNFRLAHGSLKARSFTVFGPEGPRTISLDMARLRPLFTLASIGGAALIAFYASRKWELWLMARNAVPFGTADPILGHDIAFYVFQLPFLHFVHGLALVTTVLAALGAGAAYFAGQNLLFDPQRGLMLGAAARKHLGALAAVLLLLLACRAWLGIPELLTTPSGAVHGASYVDVYARIPTQWVLVIVGVVGAGLALYQMRETRLWPLMAAAGAYFGLALLGSLYALGLQRFVVAPNEQVRETPYIAHSIRATRAGFALDDVVERGLSGEAALTRADIDRNGATLDNVPLWNEQPLLDAFGQIQEIRTYYDFVSVHNDRYVIDGQYRQIMLSAREMNSTSLPSTSWINERLTFTHGYGITLGPVNEVTPEGLPLLFIKDLPLKSSVDLTVTQPAIYFGELSNDHVFVKTATKEFDYPRGDDNVFGTYGGKGGVALDSVMRRLMFALRFASPDTFFSPNITEQSRVLMYRRIAERVKRIAPFLVYDSAPYLAISQGRLLWVQDAYTTSSRYPYSKPAGGINYIRNSVKVTVDAYDGTVTFHVLDTEDPVVATLARIFPTLFKPIAHMPEDLRGRLRYPQGIFGLQAAVFATFHMTNPATFYNGEDQWDIPSLEQGPQAKPMAPYYTVMKLPGEAGAEYIQMLPYTPRQKDNLAAWIVARSDGENYGQLVVFQLPKQTVIFGPRQIAARISQDQVIAPQITLWNQQGSAVIQGSLLVIPIEESLLYIRPMYLKAANGRIPELKRVIVAYQNRIVMENTLDAALERLFPGGGVSPAVARTQPVRPLRPEPAPQGASEEASSLAAQAQQAYQRALQAQREGNWAQYGEEIRQLGELLQRMNQRPSAPQGETL